MRDDALDSRLDTSPAIAAIGLDAVGVRVGDTALLSALDLAIAYGAPTLVLGPNGSGKSTLLRLMMQLIEPSEGRILFGPAPDGSTACRAFVFQKPVMLRRSVAENVAFALEAKGLARAPGTIAALLAEVGLSAQAQQPARKLSGGEQQRLALARALARAPDILILDEPTASLDPAQTMAVEDIIQSAAAKGVKIIMSTHDLGQARRIGGEVVFLVGGRIVEQATAKTFFAKPKTEKARRFLAGELVT